MSTMVGNKKMNTRQNKPKEAKEPEDPWEYLGQVVTKHYVEA